jgi:hypothetical protein
MQHRQNSLNNRRSEVYQLHHPDIILGHDLYSVGIYLSCHAPSMTAESVIVSPDGRAMMLNKFGGVFEAYEGADGNYKLNRTAKAWLGPGRPLGAAFDAAGNIIICDALKVFSQLNVRQTHIMFATAFPASHAVLVASSVALI